MTVLLSRSLVGEWTVSGRGRYSSSGGGISFGDNIQRRYLSVRTSETVGLPGNQGTDLPSAGFERTGKCSSHFPTIRFGDSEYYLWYFEEDWEVRAHFQTTYLYDAELNGLIEYPYPPVAQGWCYNGTDQILLGSTESVTGNQIVGRTIQSIKPTDHRLSVLYSIRVQQRNLSRMEYEYYQVRAKLNNEMGGLFTPQPSELPTNITCSNPTRKVIGYVGCNMGVAHAQLYIPEEEVVYIDSYSCDIGKDPAGSYLDKYAAGFR